MNNNLTATSEKLSKILDPTEAGERKPHPAWWENIWITTKAFRGWETKNFPNLPQTLQQGHEMKIHGMVIAFQSIGFVKLSMSSSPKSSKLEQANHAFSKTRPLSMVDVFRHSLIWRHFISSLSPLQILRSSCRACGFHFCTFTTHLPNRLLWVLAFEHGFSWGWATLELVDGQPSWSLLQRPLSQGTYTGGVSGKTRLPNILKLRTHKSSYYEERALSPCVVDSHHGSGVCPTISA